MTSGNVKCSSPILNQSIQLKPGQVVFLNHLKVQLVFTYSETN